MADEYIRKQDAVDLVNKISNLDLKAKGGICVSLANLEKADVAPVVRCKNCKHHAYDEIFSCYWCEYPGRVRDTTPDGFCEKGEE